MAEPTSNRGEQRSEETEGTAISLEDLNLFLLNANQRTCELIPEIGKFLQSIGEIATHQKSADACSSENTLLDRHTISQKIGTTTRVDADFRTNPPFILTNPRDPIPRILVVTPEITRLPAGMGDIEGEMITAKAGGLADMSASLVSELYRRGADVHVTLPNYRRLFNVDVTSLEETKRKSYQSELANAGVHLAEDRVFHHRKRVYTGQDNIDMSLVFQREVINNIIPRVQPDIIHCNDWMTGLIPAVANKLGIPTLFTIHNIHTRKVTLGDLERSGIEPTDFWDRLYYERYPGDYWEAFESNGLDLLTSGIFAADTINVVSPTFLKEIASGSHDCIPHIVRHEVAAKLDNNRAFGVINAPDPSFDPTIDQMLKVNYGPATALRNKATNKLAFQSRLGLERNGSAPLFFWPSRLDPIQKGCRLLTDILYDVVSTYWGDRLQIAVVADGPFQEHFHSIVDRHQFRCRVAVCDFDDELSHLGYAASDFLFMPSQFEPCGLSQMIGCIYGSLPIAHDTGGLHDTVQHLDVNAQTGNGFLFNDFDSKGLRWAIDRAMDFYRLEATIKAPQISRVMEEGRDRFNYRANASSYLELYEDMLGTSVVP